MLKKAAEQAVRSAALFYRQGFFASGGAEQAPELCGRIDQSGLLTKEDREEILPLARRLPALQGVRKELRSVPAL